LITQLENAQVIPVCCVWKLGKCDSHWN